MDFLNNDHEERFFKIKESMPVKFYTDRERLAVIYLMAGNQELCDKIAPYINWEEGFYSDEMFEKEDFSTGLKVMAKLAVVLYNNGLSLDFQDLYVHLDETNLQLALNAANYRYNRNPKGIYEVDDTNSYLK